MDRWRLARACLCNACALRWTTGSGARAALAPEPVVHRSAQALQRHARANLHLSIAGGNSVVEDLVVGEIAHTEAVQPLQRAGMPLPGLLVLDSYLAGEHFSIVTRAPRFAGDPMGKLTGFLQGRKQIAMRASFSCRTKLNALPPWPPRDLLPC